MIKKCGPGDTPIGYAKRKIEDGETITITIGPNGIWLSPDIEFLPPYSEPKYRCPECGGLLCKVTRPSNSPLNEEQFDSVRAGDYYCPLCKGDRGKTGYRYYWIRELQAKLGG